MSAGMDTSTPRPMTSRKLSPRPSVLVAAIGPGVGGMNTCDVYRPADSATVMATDEDAVRWASARRIGLRMTKPESQKTGIDTFQPMSWMARTGRFLPIRCTIASASRKAPPVTSRTMPISAPRMITYRSR